jgi:hypothetical protein
MKERATKPLAGRIAEWAGTLLLVSVFFAWLFRWQITYTRYGFFGAWVLLPGVLIVTAVALSIYYERRLFVRGGVWQRFAFAVLSGLVSTVLAITASEFISRLLWGLPPHISGP